MAGNSAECSRQIMRGGKVHLISDSGLQTRNGAWIWGAALWTGAPRQSRANGRRRAPSRGDL